jgi:hypothetical protein
VTGWLELIAGDIGRPTRLLWPEAYPIDALQGTRKNTPARFFSALPKEGDYFKAEWLRPYDNRRKTH